MLAELCEFPAWAIAARAPQVTPRRRTFVDPLISQIAADPMINALIGPVVSGSAPAETRDGPELLSSGWAWRQDTAIGPTIRLGTNHAPAMCGRGALWGESTAPSRLVEAAQCAADIVTGYGLKLKPFAPIECFRDALGAGRAFQLLRWVAVIRLDAAVAAALAEAA